MYTVWLDGLKRPIYSKGYILVSICASVTEGLPCWIQRTEYWHASWNRSQLEEDLATLKLRCRHQSKLRSRYQGYQVNTHFNKIWFECLITRLHYCSHFVYNDPCVEQTNKQISTHFSQDVQVRLVENCQEKTKVSFLQTLCCSICGSIPLTTKLLTISISIIKVQFIRSTQRDCVNVNQPTFK